MQLSPCDEAGHLSFGCWLVGAEQERVLAAAERHLSVVESVDVVVVGVGWLDVFDWGCGGLGDIESPHQEACHLLAAHCLIRAIELRHLTTAERYL